MRVNDSFEKDRSYRTVKQTEIVEAIATHDEKKLIELVQQLNTNVEYLLTRIQALETERFK